MLENIVLEDNGIDNTTSTENNGTATENNKNEDSTNLNPEINNDEPEKIDDNSQKQEETETTESANENKKEEIEHDLAPGTKIELAGKTYVVNDNGDVLDSDGNIFKQKSEVKNWIDSYSVEDENKQNTDINVSQIAKELNLEIVDENGKEVEFENTQEGIKSFIDSAIKIKQDEIQNDAINSLFNQKPYLKQLDDYVTITGSTDGYGKLPDRSNIKLSKDDKIQQINIIKQAAKECGNTTLNDNYIKYLEDNNALYDEAKIQLTNLINRDKQRAKEYEDKANEIKRLEQEKIDAYMKEVDNVIKTNKLAGYEIPKNFVKVVDGQKINYNLDNFYNYITRVGNDNKTDYQRALENMDITTQINNDLLSAWLTYTGGDFSALIAHALDTAKVEKLKIISNTNKQRTSGGVIKLTPPKTEKVNPAKIMLGS